MIDSFEGDYAFLSNFAPSPIWGPRDLPCATVEHAFQAAKAMSYMEALQVVKMPTPGKAKRAGRQVTLRPDWNESRINWMRLFVHRKFEIPLLRDLLVSTEDHELVEGNNWNDTFWGVCRGKGENRLGQILMEVRSKLA